MSRAPRPIGVLGGMGPAATLDFLAKVQARTPPGARDQDHLRLLVDINPQVPDRNAALRGDGPSPAPALVAMAQGLERAGAEALVMVCNSAHAFAPDIRAAVGIPLISIVEETVAAVRRQTPQARHVALLAADACLQAQLYQRAFASVGVATVELEPNRQRAFMDVIYRIKSGVVGDDERLEMRSLAEQLLDGDADLAIAACTEVPLALSERDLSKPLIDSTSVLVDGAVAFAWRQGS